MQEFGGQDAFAENGLSLARLKRGDMLSGPEVVSISR